MGRLLSWQLALVTLVVSVGAPRVYAIAGVLAALAMITLTTVRIHGRLLYHWLASAVRYGMRPHRTTLVAGDSTAQDFVQLVTDHGRIETVEIDGTPIAFIHQSDGISVVLELRVSRDTEDPVWRTLLGVSSLLPPPDSGTPAFSAQLLVQTTPPADLNGLRGDFGVPSRQAWVTVQALRTADVHSSDELSLALSNAIQRMIRRLGRDDVPTRALDRDETLTLVSALAKIDGDSDEPLRVEETWSSWTAGDTAQACFSLDGWDDTDQSVRQRILHRLDLIPSRGTTVAIAAQRHDRRLDVPAESRVYIRITERDADRLENSASLLSFALEDIPEVRPERLDGDHLTGLAASLPVGAGPVLRR